MLDDVDRSMQQVSGLRGSRPHFPRSRHKLILSKHVRIFFGVSSRIAESGTLFLQLTSKVLPAIECIESLCIHDE